MISEEFDANDWIERLGGALPALVKAQEPYLQAYWRHNPREHVVVDGRDVTPFPLDDLRMLYARARHARAFGSEAQYASLRPVLDTARHALISHPTLARVAVAGRVIGDNDFWMRILNSGTSMELSGDRWTAARELNAFLSPVDDAEAADVLGNLDS